MHKSILLLSCLVILSGCVTKDSEKYRTIETLSQNGLKPLSDEAVAELVTDKTLVGEYVSTPKAQYNGRNNTWMEYFDPNGTTKYRYCEAKKGQSWDCAKRVTGSWKLEKNNICFKYKDSAIYDRCFAFYKEGENYLLVATTYKASGYVRAKITKSRDGFVESEPFNN